MQHLYSYEELKDMLADAALKAVYEAPESDQAKLARERYQRFAEHGFIPDDLMDEVGEFLVW